MAIVMAFNPGMAIHGFTTQEIAFILIGAAAAFDFCDGLSARLLKAYSPMGKELDSLSDLVSFGLAPAFLVMQTMLAHTDYPLIPLVSLLIALMGALRLAKFNVDTRQTTSFIGLPIPANAIFWIGASGWITRYGYPGTAVMVIAILLVSIWMTSNMRMFSLKFKNFDWQENFRRYIVLLATAVFIFSWGVSGLMWAIVLYGFISLMGRKEA